MAMVGRPAAAQDLSYSRTIENWEIFGGRADDGEGLCIMRGEYLSGTVVSVAMTGAQPEDFYFSFHNPAWQSLTVGQSLSITVKFDRGPEWTIDAQVTTRTEDGPGFIFRAPLTERDGDSFVIDFMLAHTMRIERGRTLVDSFNLSGTRASVIALVECNSRVGNAPGFDPFSTR